MSKLIKKSKFSNNNWYKIKKIKKNQFKFNQTMKFNNNN